MRIGKSGAIDEQLSESYAGGTSAKLPGVAFCRMLSRHRGKQVPHSAEWREKAATHFSGSGRI